MVDSYEEYEEACRAIRKENAELLDGFVSWLQDKGLSEKTIRRHLQNVDLYLDAFLLYDDATPAAEGVDQVGHFLGYWFIRKALWASPNSIRQSAASLKKFYQFMVERGLVDREALDDLKAEIREELPEWQDALRRYQDPSIDDPWGIGEL
jgi:site-specific recombinase XerD